MAKKKPAFDIEAIKNRLPHRFPFLMVDRILETGADHSVGVKNVTVNEPFFQGHFPGESIMPGVLIAEAMVQTAAFIGGDPAQDAERPVMKKAFLTSVNMRIRRPVVPGDQLLITMKRTRSIGKISKCTGEVAVDGEVIASGEFNVAEA